MKFGFFSYLYPPHPQNNHGCFDAWSLNGSSDELMHTFKKMPASIKNDTVTIRGNDVKRKIQNTKDPERL